MIKVAIVEDKDKEAGLLSECLQKYREEKGAEFSAVRFYDAESFLAAFKAEYDIVFMDIELPGINGMEAARLLRALDDQVVLIFVTNMAQYAVKGYEVAALDYIVKPVKYQKLLFKLQRAVAIVNANREAELIVAQVKGIARISTKDLYYVEVSGHKLTYHTTNGIVLGFGSLSDLEKNLKNYHFMRCNSCYLVNPRFIALVQGLDIIMRDGSELKISQPKRKQFMNDLTNWLGQGRL